MENQSPDTGSSEHATTSPLKTLNTDRCYARNPGQEFTPFLPYLDELNPIDDERLMCVADLKLDEQWINLDMFRSWLAACDQHHGNRCRSTDDGLGLSRPPKGTDWLMGVENFCLIKALPGMVYFALSYVWGISGTESACTLQENIGALQEIGALRGNPITMSNTILHAAQLKKLLDRRYLWVDRFCLVSE
jgi:hypothetical protein